MTDKTKKTASYGVATVFFLFSLYYFDSAIQGRIIVTHAAPMDTWQMVGAGCILLIFSIIMYITGFKSVISNLTLSERLENRETRNKNMQNQQVDPIVTTPVESGKVQGTAGHP